MSEYAHRLVRRHRLMALEDDICIAIDEALADACRAALASGNASSQPHGCQCLSCTVRRAAVDAIRAMQERGHA